MKKTNIIQRLCLFLFVLVLAAPAWAEDVTLQDDGGTKYVNMPKTGTNTLTIPAGVTSFKLYDDGGKDGNYSDNCHGALVLTAPAGYRLQLSGVITTTNPYPLLYVYDNNKASGRTLLEEVNTNSGVRTAIPTVVSSGQHMTVHFYDFYHPYVLGTFEGLDLTVTLVDPNAPNKVNIVSATGGTVASNKAQGDVLETITLTATPASGHVLESIDVKDTNGNGIAVDGGNWHTNNATFTMPLGGVTVTPKFTNDLTADGGLYINMLQRGYKAAAIPAGVTSFKVYDDGGKDGRYSNDCNSTLVLIAPEGCRLQLSGNITAEDSNCDYLYAYDGENSSSSKLLNGIGSSPYGKLTAIPTVTSSGKHMALHFRTDDETRYAGLDLTVRVLRPTFTPTLSFTEATQKAWALTPPTVSGVPSDYDGKPTYSSNAAVKVDANGKLTPGGNSCFGQTATITINYPATAKYDAATASYTIKVDADKTMPLASPADWKKFCDLVNGGQNAIDAKLTQDIDLGTELCMIGTERELYNGTFDGGGHSIKVNWNASEKVIALFRYTEGATIKNLYTQGSINSSSENAFFSGMVGRASGHTDMTGCSSMVNLTATGANSHGAGLIAHQFDNSTASITDCVVGGVFHGTTAINWYGFLYSDGNYDSGTTFTNCLYIGKNNARPNAGNTFVNGGTVLFNNCYYLKPCGAEAPRTIKVTEEQLRIGKVAHKLQAGRNENVWGQTLGTDNNPLLTTDATKRVHRVEFKYNNNVVATHYINNGKTVTPPTVQDIVGSNYDPHHYYTFAFSENITSSTPINADKTVAITLTEKDYFEIGSPNDWQKFCEVVNGGQNAIDAKLTEDIDLAGNIWMVGTLDHKYSGTFDGQGHNITVDWNVNEEGCALFRLIDGATIKNLHIQGDITTSFIYGRISGMVWKAWGNVTFTNCSSMTNLHATKNNGQSAGFIVDLQPGANATLTDCIVGGDFKGARDSWRGFVFSTGGSCTLKNCLYLGTNNATTHSRPFVYGGTFNLENCFYLNPCGEAQGEQTDEEDLKTGKLLAKLGSAWAQKLGYMPELYSENKKDEDNYLYYDTEKAQWTCNNFSLAKHPPFLPIGIDFTAARIKDSRTFAETDKTCTMCLPYDFPINGFKAYTLSGNTGTTLRFKEVEGKLEAYHPYYIVLNGLQSTDGENLQVKVYNDKALEKHEGDYTFRGTMFKIDNMSAASHNAYILQDDKQWHKVMAGNAAVNIPAYRACIMPKLQVGAKTLSISFDDETTGISAIETTDLDGTVRYYDLSGRYIGTSLKGQPRGVYVGNGKKILKK